jgi:hypothetical protein
MAATGAGVCAKLLAALKRAFAKNSGLAVFAVQV